MGAAMPAAIDLPFKIHHKQPPHAFNQVILRKSMENFEEYVKIQDVGRRENQQKTLS